MRAYIMGMLLDLFKQTLRRQVGNDPPSRFIAFHSGILAALFIDRFVVIHYIDDLQIMAFSNFKIIRVMCRRNFYDTRPEFLIYIRI